MRRLSSCCLGPVKAFKAHVEQQTCGQDWTVSLNLSHRFNNFEILIHAFITTRLYYCNALYFGMSQTLLSQLQLVQNTAAHLLTGTKKHEHITPVWASFHWLPVHSRVDFQQATLLGCLTLCYSALIPGRLTQPLFLSFGFLKHRLLLILIVIHFLFLFYLFTFFSYPTLWPSAFKVLYK